MAAAAPGLSVVDTSVVEVLVSSSPPELGVEAGGVTPALEDSVDDGLGALVVLGAAEDEAAAEAARQKPSAAGRTSSTQSVSEECIRHNNRGKLTDSNVVATGLDHAGVASSVDGLVVGLDTPAHGVLQVAVGGLLGRIVEAVQRALGEVVRLLLGAGKAGQGHSGGKDNG